MLTALSPLAIKRECVAVLKPLVIFSWHWAQVSEPTNVAPGICGGATTVRVTVAQEITTTASAAPLRIITSFLRQTFRLGTPRIASALSVCGFINLGLSCELPGL